MLLNKITKSILAALLLAAVTACSPAQDNTQLTANGTEKSDNADTNFALLAKLIALPTFRLPDKSNETTTLKNLELAQQAIWQDLQAFNQTQKNIKFYQHQWQKTINGQNYWVYAFRIGSGEKLLSIISHLDTVAPGDMSWRPFELRQEQRAFSDQPPQTFLVGRGAIDDKGPAVFALDAIKHVAKYYDDKPEALANNTIEMLFDTSEETDMSMPHYFNDCPNCEPDFGIVFDSKWCVRAEKGIERPQFYMPLTSLDNSGISILSIDTYNNPVNQIPGKVSVRFTAKDEQRLDAFKASIEQQYQTAVFDDPHYRKAKMNIAAADSTEKMLQLDFHVAGAQHGSVPDKNRESGANPLVSALNFINSLQKSQKIQNNSYTQLAAFATWAWGTQVLGQHHETLLAQDDGVFSPGTSYTVSKIEEKVMQGQNSLVLSVDIRFSLDHNSQTWDGRDGTIAGTSKFSAIFTDLVKQYQQASNQKISFNSKMLYAPDVRNSEGTLFKMVNTAYKKVTGVDCPMTAIGGGTDAKGRPQLLAVGPLFKAVMGSPVNYHGLNEAAPLNDLVKSRDILINILKQAVSQ